MWCLCPWSHLIFLGQGLSLSGAHRFSKAQLVWEPQGSTSLHSTMHGLLLVAVVPNSASPPCTTSTPHTESSPGPYPCIYPWKLYAVRKMAGSKQQQNQFYLQSKMSLKLSIRSRTEFPHFLRSEEYQLSHFSKKARVVGTEGNVSAVK